jgi:hypothetical protein
MSSGRSSAPDTRVRRRVRLLFFLALGAGLLALLGRLWGAGLVDDAFIFCRYADNLVRGVGTVFNAGERVEGFTSAGWMLMLAAIRLVTARLDLAALMLSAAAAICVGALVYDWLGRYFAGGDQWTSWLLAIGLLSLPAIVYWGLSGMEEVFFSLVVTGVLISAWADDQRQSVSARTVLLLIAALLARPEGALLLAWIAAFLTLRSKRLDARWWRSVAAPLAIVLAALGLMLLVRFAYYGSIVPNTYYAKVTPDWSGRARAGAVYLQRFLFAHSPLLIFVMALFVSAAKQKTLPQAGVALLAGWIGIWCAYVEWAGGDHFGMFRFMLPVLPALILLMGVVGSSVRDRFSAAQRLFFRGALILAFSLSIFVSLEIEGFKARTEPVAARAWAAAGKWIAGNTPPDTVVATNVIGAIGYFSKRRIVDMAGLVDPVVAREGTLFPEAAPGHARYDTDYIFRRSPDLVVYYTSGMAGAPPFTRPDQLLPAWHISLIEFLRDPRCSQLYDHVAVRLENGTWLEMQKKRTFALPPGYLTETSSAATHVALPILR